MVKDINPTGGSNPSQLINVNGTLYFSATDGEGGIELFKSDGSSAGTAMVKDINLGGGDSSPTQLTNVGGELFFTATDGTAGRELWKSDGTAIGTLMVKDIRTGSGDSTPTSLTNADGTLFFQANDGASGYELWKSDGTSVGTVLVKDINPGAGSSNPIDLTNVDGTVYFGANDGPHSGQLWKSDGTAGGTAMVKNLSTVGGSISDVFDLINVSGTLYFGFGETNATVFQALWMTDGTDAGTVFVENLDPTNQNNTPAYPVNSEGTLFFSVNSVATGAELWDLTPSIASPTATIGAPSTSLTGTASVSFTITYTDATTVTLTSGDVSVTSTGTAAASNITVNGTGFTRTVTLSGITGDGTLGISLAAGTATDGSNSAPAAGPSTTFTVDNTAPSVSIGSPSASLTGTSSVSFTVTYSDANPLTITLASGDVSVNSTGTAAASVITVTGSGNTRTITLSGITGDGTLGFTLAAGTATDTINSAPASSPGATFAVDNTAPTVSIGNPSASITTTNSVSYLVTYADANPLTISLASGDVMVNSTGTASTTTITITGSGNTRTITLSGITGDGTLGFTLAAGTATDTINSAPASSPGATFAVDNTAPTVSIASPSPVVGVSSIFFTVTYGSNPSSITLSPSDVTVFTTGSATYETVTVTGTGNTRTITLSGISGLGTLSLSLGSNTATDEAGNQAPATAPTSPVAITPAPPSLATHFALTSTNVTGSSVSITVMALDEFEHVVTGYSGTVHFSSSDSFDILPPDSTLTDGVATFSLTLNSPGTRSITATDTTNQGLVGSTSVTTTRPQSQAGTVYLDLNANGVADPGEPGLAGRAVFADLDGDLAYEVGEPITTTDAVGNFALPGVAPGSAGIFEATSQDDFRRHVVDQFHTNADGSLAIGVVPISPVAPVPVVPNPFDAAPSSDANAAFVQSLYHAVLGRVGGDSEVAGWVTGLAAGMTREQVARGFVNSPEHRMDQVTAYYREFLHRAPDSSSQYWVDALLSGASEESVVQSFLTYPEYQASHQDPAHFVSDLYLDVLGRQGGESEVAAWESNLASGTSREAVVAYFVNAPEAIDQVVDSFYAAYLHRQPDPTSADWEAMLEMPNPSATDVAVGFLDSEEFFQAARHGR